MTGVELPLSNLRVLVTRPAEQAGPLIEALERAGAIAVPYATIALEPPHSWTPFDAAVGDLATYSWVIFTSPSAARFAFGRAPALAVQLGSAGAPRVAVVGQETARKVAAYGVPVAVVPDDQRQEGLVAALGVLPAGTRVMFPQAVGGRELLRDELVRAGAVVDVVPVSRTVHLSLERPPPAYDAVIFASPSALHALIARESVTALQGKVIAVMGPTTRAAAMAAGLSVQVVAPTPSVSALVAALCAYRRPP